MTSLFQNIKNWYKGQSTEKKVSYILLLLILIYVLAEVIIGQIHSYQLQNDGIYYVAKIDRIASGKSGGHYYIEYTYNNKKYTGSFKPFFDYKPNYEGAYIFIKLLPHNPSVYQHLDEGEVSDSLIKIMPQEGWLHLPDVPRQYMLEGNHIQYK